MLVEPPELPLATFWERVLLLQYELAGPHQPFACQSMSISKWIRWPQAVCITPPQSPWMPNVCMLPLESQSRVVKLPPPVIPLKTDAQSSKVYSQTTG